jgi:galactokinase
MIDPDDLAREFEAWVGRAPRLYRAPGRVNLIGEHTDYNDGFVLPLALDRSTWAAAAPRDDGTLVVRSREYGETATIDLDDAGDPRTRPSWARYVIGVATVVSEGVRGFLPSVRGADMLIASDVPIGAGLSSSAALEVACASALVDLAGVSMDLERLALACQRAEHEFAGTRCGIMDQMIACYGRAGHALMLDTRSLSRTYVPLPASVRVVVCNTMVAHALASAEYNARRADCEAGVGALEKCVARAWHVPGTCHAPIHALRDATLDDLHAIRDTVSPRVFRRCRHVITENDRVVRAAAALAANDCASVGMLMAASHASLRDDYEVSCPELDAMASIVSSLEGVFGARMTGGGFGGCVVALVDAAAATEQFQQTIQERYISQTGKRPDVWVCAAGNGVASLSSTTSASLS